MVNDFGGKTVRKSKRPEFAPGLPLYKFPFFFFRVFSFCAADKEGRAKQN